MCEKLRSGDEYIRMQVCKGQNITIVVILQPSFCVFMIVHVMYRFAYVSVCAHDFQGWSPILVALIPLCVFFEIVSLTEHQEPTGEFQGSPSLHPDRAGVLYM